MDFLPESIQKLIADLTPQFLGVLMTLVILIIGIRVAKMIANFAKKGLNKLQINEKFNSKGDATPVDFAAQIAKLVYYVIVLNVVLIVLERLGITSVLDPLKNLSQQFLQALPKIIAAGIIFYAGWIIANLAASFVGLAASKVDDVLEQKGFSPEFKISKFFSAFVLGGVLLPIVVAGFQKLDIEPVSRPAIKMIEDFMGAVPNIVGAGLILVVTYIIGKFIVYMLSGLLEGMNANQLPEKMGFQTLLPSGTKFVEVIGNILLFFIMLTAMTGAIGMLNITMVSEIFARLVDFASGLALGGVILLAGTFLANLAYNKINTTPENSHLAGVARIAILGLVLAMGLKAMGLADHIVNMAFGLTFGAVAIATAVSFGVGGIDAAKKITGNWADKLKK